MGVEGAGAEVAGHSPKHQVAGRKSVRLLHRTHRDVLRRPRTNARYVEQGVDHRWRCEHQLPGHNPLSERPNGLCPRSNNTGFFKRSIGKCGGEWKQPIDVVLGDDALTPTGRDAAGDGGRAAHRYLLAKNGADRELERIPRGGQPYARVAGARGVQ